MLIHASGKDVGKERRDAIRATWISDIDLISEELGQEVSYKYVSVHHTDVFIIKIEICCNYQVLYKSCDILLLSLLSREMIITR